MSPLLKQTKHVLLERSPMKMEFTPNERLDAALAAVWLHGAAADRCKARTGERFLLPSDVIGELKMPEEA